jgi:glycosyltransferase involved in cell wall biosynthesis
MIMNLYRAIDRRRIQFDFMVHTNQRADYDDEIEALGGRIYRVPAFWGFNPLSYQAALRRHFTNHPEHRVIHGHIASCAALYLGVARQFGRTTICHSHSSSNGNLLEKLLLGVAHRPIPRVADYLVACSDDAACNKFGKDAHHRANYRFIANAVDTEAYAFDPQARAEVRQELGLGDATIIGHVGRFVDVKNHLFLLEVFRDYRAKNSQAHLLLVGDGHLRPTVEKKAAELGLSPFVTFTGVRGDVSRLMSAMDLFCVPSKYEGLPVVTVEAQACGLPTLISTGVPDQAVVTDLARRFPLLDGAEGWARHIETALAQAPPHRGLGAVQVAQAGFDVKTTAAWLADFYDSIASPTSA